MSFVASIQADINNFTSNLDKAQARMDAFSQDIGSKVAKVGQTFQAIGGAISIGVTAPLTALGVAAYNMAADFEDALGAVDQIFKDASGATKDWANSLPTYFGIAKKEALEYSNMMGSMLVNIGGLTEKEASKQSAMLIELAGDLTAMYGGTTQDAVRALTGALKGNNTMLDNYGMAANDALVKAKALSLGLVEQGKEMSLSAKQAATLALIYEQSGSAQGQAAREAEGASGSMRALRTEITNLTTEIGNNLLPIITPIVTRLKEMVAGFREMSPETQRMIVMIGGAVAALGPFMVALGGILKLVPLVGAAFSVMTGPIGIAVAAIGAAAYVIIKNWDSVKEYFSNGAGAKLWNSISNGAKALWGALKSIFNSIQQFITNVWDKIGADVTASVKAAWDIVVDVVSFAINLVSNVLNVFTAFIKGDFNAIVSSIGTLFSDTFYGALNIVNDVFKKMGTSVASWLKLIGADGLGKATQDFVNSIGRFETATDKANTKQEAFNKSNVAYAEIARQATFDLDAFNKSNAEYAALQDTSNEATKSIIPTTEAAKKATKDYRSELDNLLASWGIYEAQSKVLSASFKEIDTNAKLAGASVAEFQTIASKQWVDKAILELDRLKDSYKSISLTGDSLPGLSTGFNIPVSLTVDEKKSTKSISNLGAKSKKALAKVNADIQQVLQSGLSNGIADMASAIGTTLIEGGGFIDAVGKSLLSSLGSVLTSLGKMAIEAGLGILAVQESLKTLNPYVALAAGAALVAIGSMFSAGAKNLGGSMGKASGAVIMLQESHQPTILFRAERKWQ